VDGFVCLKWDYLRDDLSIEDIVKATDDVLLEESVHPSEASARASENLRRRFVRL
jgi:hypothetical protein